MPGYLQSCPRPQTQAGETVLSNSSTNRYALLTGAPRSANATCIMPAHVIDGAGHETRGVPWLLQCLPLWRAHLSRSADAKHPMTFMSKVDLPLGGETTKLMHAAGRGRAFMFFVGTFMFYGILVERSQGNPSDLCRTQWFSDYTPSSSSPGPMTSARACVRVGGRADLHTQALPTKSFARRFLLPLFFPHCQRALAWCARTAVIVQRVWL